MDHDPIRDRLKIGGGGAYPVPARRNETALSRSGRGHQRPRCVWFTGLPASGKSTLGNALARRLAADDCRSVVLDGDELRRGLNRDLGFSVADRAESARRTAEVARLMVETGVTAIVCLISPSRVHRAFARSLFTPGDYIEIYVDTPLAECERRDPKGLYARARAGEVGDLTGLDSPYEPPDAPEFVVRTLEMPPERAVASIRTYLLAT